MWKSIVYLAGAAGICALAGEASAAPAPAPVQAPPGAACAVEGAECFVLVSLTLDGVSAYPLRELAPLYADYLARPVSQADLVAIAQAITDKYRSDGYFLSRAVVPPQGDTPGQARLRIYEGYVSELEVTGDAAPALKALLNGLTGSRPLKLADLERRLTLGGDLPGLRVRSALKPILEDPAQHRLEVDAGLQRWTGSVYIDNRGPKSLGPDQAQVRVAGNSLWRTGDQLSVSMITVPSDVSAVLQGELAYGLSFADGGRLRAGVYASRSRTGMSVLNNPAGSDGHGLNLRYARPLSRARKHAVWASAAFDARHIEQLYLNGGAYEDELRVLRGSLQASRTSAQATSSVFGQVSRGLGAFGASRRPGVGRSRFDADGEFWKFNAGASHFQAIGARAGIYVSADAQWAPKPLLLSEEFAHGGLPYGRAYNYAEISGDSGVAGLAEFRVGWDPKRAPLTFFQTYAFVDAAKVWNGRSGARSSADLASAGAGLRLTFWNKATVRIEAAKPIGPAPWEIGTRKWRGFVSFSAAI